MKNTTNNLKVVLNNQLIKFNFIRNQEDPQKTFFKLDKDLKLLTVKIQN